MTDFQTALMGSAIYKAITILAGVAFGYMGFRLFLRGQRGAAEAQYEQRGARTFRFSYRAPGAAFAFFGASSITTSLVKGFDVESIRGATPSLWLPTEVQIHSPTLQERIARKDVAPVERK